MIRKLILVGILLLLIGVGALPSLLSSRWGAAWIGKQLSHRIDAQVEIGAVSLSWWKGQTFDQIQVNDPEFSAHCEQVTCSATLFSILGSNFEEVSFLRPSVKLSKPFSPIAKREKEMQTATLGLVPIKWSPKLRGDFTLLDGKVEVAAEGQEPVSLENISASCSLPKGESGIDGRVTADKLILTFNAHEMNTSSQQVSVALLLEKFPVRILDQLVSLVYPQFGGRLIAAVGPELSIDAKTEIGAQIFDISCKIDSKLLSGELETVTENGLIQLKRGAKFTWDLTPQLVRFKNLSLDSPTALKLTISALKTPVPDQWEDLQALALDARLEMTSKGEFTIRDTQVELKAFEALIATERWIDGLDTSLHLLLKTADSESTVAFNGKCQGRQCAFDFKADQFPIGLFVPAIGETIDASGSLNLGDQSRVVLQAKSTLWNLSPSQWLIGDTIQLVHPTSLSYQPIGSEPLVLWVKSAKVPVKNVDRTQITAEIEGPHLVIDSYVFDHLRGDLQVSTFDQITLHLEPFSVCSISQGAQADFKVMEIRGKVVGEEGSFQINSQMALSGEPAGSLLATVEASKKEVAVEGRIDHLSPHIIAIIFDLPQLDDLIGSSLNLKFQGKNRATGNRFDLNLSSQNINFGGICTWNDEALRIEKFEGALSLTPEGYVFLDQLLTQKEGVKRPYQLKQTAKVQLLFRHLYYPFESGTEPTVSGVLECSDLAFVDLQKNGLPITFKNLKVDFDRTHAQGPISFHLASAVNKSGQISIAGEGDLTTRSIKVDGKIQHLPPSAIDFFARIKGRTDAPFSSLFGETLNGNFQTELKQFTGPVAINLNSSNTRAALNGQFTNGTLTLNEPIHAQITVTPQVSKLILHQLNPLDLTAISAKNPLTLQIDPKGFSFPFRPYKADQIQIPSARIELGQIICHNEGTLSKTLDLLKSHDIQKQGELHLWFTPIDIHVEGGVATVERTEILLANTFEIATWGQVDVPAHYVDMVIGLTRQTLGKAFGIRDLPQNYVLQIPMKGPFDNVQINSGEAAAKIGLLLVWQKRDLAGGIGKGKGAAFGNLLGQMVPLPDADRQAPAPKRPFPWETKNPQTSHEDKLHIKSGDKPLKQLFKMLR